MIPAVRQQSIVNSLRRHGGLSVGELAGVLQVSPSTIRRDLGLMEETGIVKRTFGGAVLVEDHDDPLDEVQFTNADAKQFIATQAAALVKDGMTVILDIGTTTLALAQQLRGRNLTVATASVPIFLFFMTDPTVKLLLLGGGYRSDYQCTSGHLTVGALKEIRADIGFLGCSGISSDATIRDTTLDQVTVKRAIIESCDETVLLADASKFPGKGSYVVASAKLMRRVVTDLTDLGPIAEVLNTSGTEVITA